MRGINFAMRLLQERDQIKKYSKQRPGYPEMKRPATALPRESVDHDALEPVIDDPHHSHPTNKVGNANRNSWAYWRPIYRFTWAVAQASSYRHYDRIVSACRGKVLDIGTGTGEYIKTLPQTNIYTFTDIDAPSLAVAKRRAKLNLPQGSYQILKCDGIDALQKNPGQDLISIIHVISVVPDPQHLLEAAVDSLARGGKIVVYISRFSKYSKWLCNPLFQALGFKMIDMRKMGKGWRRERAGMLNECYIYEKPLHQK